SGSTSASSLSSGSVQFFDGSVPLGVATLSAGSVTWPVSNLSVGTHAITAIFSGNASVRASSATASVQINPMPAPAIQATSTALNISPNPSSLGQAVSVRATVNSSTATSATGRVQFFDANSLLGEASLVAGVATLSVSTLSSGPHDITASFTGGAALGA